MEFLSDVGGGEDKHRPSFFELAAQGPSLPRPARSSLTAPVAEQLRDLLAPVVRYVLSVRSPSPSPSQQLTVSQVFAQRNPRYLLRIVNRHDEFFALVMFFVERHYLTAWGPSSFLSLVSRH